MCVHLGSQEFGDHLRILLALSSMWDCVARQVRFSNACSAGSVGFYCRLLQRQEGQRGECELFTDKPSRIKYMAVLCAVCAQLLTVHTPEESEVQKN